MPSSQVTHTLSTGQLPSDENASCDEWLMLTTHCAKKCKSKLKIWDLRRYRAWSVCSGWEEGGGATGGEAGTPLLDKTDESVLQRQSTVAMLLSFSAQDTPLLIVAFLAGDRPCANLSPEPILGRTARSIMRKGGL